MREIRATVVGAGFFGATVARILAEAGIKVEVLDRRDHMGGNCFDYVDEETGILIQKYGTHIFHTNNESVWNFVNQFAEFIPYEHEVKAKVSNELFTLPININTLNEVYGATLTEENVEAFLASKVEDIPNPKNIEEYCLARFGREVYELLVSGYTSKQWGAEPSKLPREIIQRIPLRLDFDNRYFTDQHQGLPKGGFTQLFSELLSHVNIEVHLNTSFTVSDYDENPNHLFIYSGPLDELFEYEYGDLDWRNVGLENEVLNIDNYQSAAVVNYPSADVPFTRIHEFKHLPNALSGSSAKTVIAREFPLAHSRDQIPAYPVRTEKNIEIAKKYEAKISNMSNFWTGGRLGSYMYLDMHMAIGQALKLSSEILEKVGLGTPHNHA